MSKVVAVVGASSNRAKFGNKALRAFKAEGYTVVPVNPNESEVEGMMTYPTVLDVPYSIDMATVYVPPDIGITLLQQFAQKGIPEIWMNPGADSDELLAEARRLELNVIAACSIIGIGRSPYQF
jgi:predicted CoA-binding protein